MWHGIQLKHMEFPFSLARLFVLLFFGFFLLINTQKVIPQVIENVNQKLQESKNIVNELRTNSITLEKVIEDLINSSMTQREQVEKLRKDLQIALEERRVLYNKSQKLTTQIDELLNISESQNNSLLKLSREQLNLQNSFSNYRTTAEKEIQLVRNQRDREARKAKILGWGMIPIFSGGVVVGYLTSDLIRGIIESIQDWR